MSKETLAYTMRTCGNTACAPCYMKDYEATEMDIVCQYLDRVAERDKLDYTFVDVGAHVGLWSLCMSEWYQNRYNIVPTIYAMEPESRNYCALRVNAQQAETGIVPVQAAAWNMTKPLFINMGDQPGRHWVTDKGFAGHSALRVNGVALDDVSQRAPQIDVMKIDVEGAELNVLNGARNILMKNEQMLLVVEVSVDHFTRYGYTAQQLRRFLQQHDYYFARPADENILRRLKSGQVKRVFFVKGEF